MFAIKEKIMSKYEKLSKEYQDILNEFIALDRKELTFDIGRINGIMEYSTHLPDTAFENEVIQAQQDLMQWKSNLGIEI